MIRKIKKLKRKFILAVCLLGISIVGVGGFLRVQQENTQALSIQALLVNIAIAEEAYYEAHGHFTQDGANIWPQVVLPSSVIVFPVQGQPDTYWASACSDKLDLRHGYELTLTTEKLGQELLINARRVVSGGWYEYQLQYRLPQQDILCQSAWAMKWFCRRITTRIKSLDIQHLIPLTK